MPSLTFSANQITLEDNSQCFYTFSPLRIDHCGLGHYSVCYLNKKIALVIMTNNDNGESIFKELLAYAIGDIYTL